MVAFQAVRCCSLPNSMRCYRDATFHQVVLAIRYYWLLPKVLYIYPCYMFRVMV
jgi:hypothetical protein